MIALAGCGSRPPPVEGTAPSEIIGRQVQIVLPSLDGEPVDVGKLRGRPVLVHFSTTGSLTSQLDIEEIRRLRQKRHDVQVLEVSVDPTKARLIRAWADASRIDWVVLLPTKDLVAGGSPFGPIRVTPTTFLIDAQGRIVWGHEGQLPRGSLAQVLSQLDSRGGP